MGENTFYLRLLFMMCFPYAFSYEIRLYGQEKKKMNFCLCHLSKNNASCVLPCVPGLVKGNVQEHLEHDFDCRQEDYILVVFVCFVLFFWKQKS